MDIENFIAEFKKTFVYEILSQTLSDEQLFERVVDGDAVLWFKEQTRQMWLMWEKAKAQAVPEGFVLVAKKSVEHWYLDEGESLWMDEPDNWLCDMDVGDVQEVEHKEYIVTESNTLYATKVWDGENQDVSSWEFFNSKDDAEKAAEYCKAMIEAQEKK